MSQSTNESDDGMLTKNQSESPLIDDGNGESSGGEVSLKKGPWTSDEDAILVEYVKSHGEGNWNAVQKHSGLSRCGKSCRLRWANHLRPNLKKCAFSQEEEALILELHAQMGNRWARMASYLPGRTDNEIKNYWNTRVKRLQRVGLPVYPPDLCMKVLQENQQGQDTGDSGQCDSLQADSFGIPDIVFNHLDSNSDVYRYVDEMLNKTTALIEPLPSQYHGIEPQTVHRQKRLRESSDVYPDASGCVPNSFPPEIDQFQNDNWHKVASSFGASFPQDPNPGQSLLSFDAAQGIHSLPNGNPSALEPANAALKSELPSLQQYPDLGLSTWGTTPPLSLPESTDVHIQTPLQGNALKSNSATPHNSGLLDALIQEAVHLSSVKKHSSEKSSNASGFSFDDMAGDGLFNMCENEWDGYAEPETESPLGHSATLFLNDCISSLDCSPPAETFTGSHGKPELVGTEFAPDKENEPEKPQESIQPDALLASDWFDYSSFIKDREIVADAIATLLEDDPVTDYKDGFDSRSSPLDQERG